MDEAFFQIKPTRQSYVSNHDRVDLLIFWTSKNSNKSKTDQIHLMGKRGKKEKKGGTDPKAAALAFLNINLGSKNIRTLKREEVHAAFVKQLHVSETS